jgi:MoaA/NifB/PqqE/SkfB family radical SAM enzyme
LGPTGDVVNVVQIHPTRRCNLRCQHCYSTSGPEIAAELPAAAIEPLLADLVAEGFNAVSFSGGEPFIYRPLPQILAAARKVGLFTSVTTNGLLLDPQRIAALAPHLSLIAISVDGLPQQHDRMRSQAGAFGKMHRKLANVRAAAIPFGIIFTLTLNNLDEMAWVAEFAVAEGASLLQVHPLEKAGRARDYELLPPDDLELSYAFLEVARLQDRYRGRLIIQFDAADRMLVAREPWRAFAIPTPKVSEIEGKPLASLVSPLVVQDDGCIVPIQYGFSPDYAIAQLDRGGFRDQAARWKREKYAAYLDLTRNVWDDIREAPEHLPFTNWYAAVTTRSTLQS